MNIFQQHKNYLQWDSIWKSLVCVTTALPTEPFEDCISWLIFKMTLVHEVFRNKDKVDNVVNDDIKCFFQQQKELSPVRFDLITPALPFVRIVQWSLNSPNLTHAKFINAYIDNIATFISFAKNSNTPMNFLDLNDLTRMIRAWLYKSLQVWDLQVWWLSR